MHELEGATAAQDTFHAVGRVTLRGATFPEGDGRGEIALHCITWGHLVGFMVSFTAHKSRAVVMQQESLAAPVCHSWCVCLKEMVNTHSNTGYNTCCMSGLPYSLNGRLCFVIVCPFDNHAYTCTCTVLATIMHMCTPRGIGTLPPPVVSRVISAAWLLSLKALGVRHVFSLFGMFAWCACMHACVCGVACVQVYVVSSALKHQPLAHDLCLVWYSCMQWWSTGRPEGG